MCPWVSMCAGTPGCVSVRTAKPRREVTCSGACSARRTAGEEAGSHPGAGKGQQELTGSIAASAAGPGRGDSLLLVSPASCGRLNNEGVCCAPPSWRYVISATTPDERPIPAPLRGQMVHSEILVCKE